MLAIIAAVLVAGGLAGVGCGLNASGIPSPVTGTPCVNDAQCADDGNPCTLERCGADGLCAVDASTGDAPQTPGDCIHHLCEAGVVVEEPDDADFEPDENDCTIEGCQAGEPTTVDVAQGEPCAVGPVLGSCQGGLCYTSCGGTDDPPCPDDEDECTIDACDLGRAVCVYTQTPGVAVADQVSGDCKLRVCGDAAGERIDEPDPLDVADQILGDCKTNVCNGSEPGTNVDVTDFEPSDNACAINSCDAGGEPVSTPTPLGTPCGNGLECNGEGTCVNCISDIECGVPEECTTPTCDSGSCIYPDLPAGTVLATQTGGDCKERQCDGSGNAVVVTDAGDLPDDGNPCTGDTCNGSSETHAPLGNGTPCNGADQCLAGTCVDCTNNNGCTPPETCGGAGVPNQCGCVDPGACDGMCGVLTDACGVQQTCPSCPVGTCVNNQCCADAGACTNKCGNLTDACGQPQSCGPCDSPLETCTNNTCVCSDPSACTGKCGMITNGCGVVVSCPGCPGGQVCEASTSTCQICTAANLASCGASETCNDVPAQNACTCGTASSTTGQACPAGPNPDCNAGVGCHCAAGSAVCGQGETCGAGGCTCGAIVGGSGQQACEDNSPYSACAGGNCACTTNPSDSCVNGFVCQSNNCRCNANADCVNGTCTNGLCVCAGNVTCAFGEICNPGNNCACAGGSCP